MGMEDVLIRAMSFVVIIFLGYQLRKIGFFKEEDFHVLSKIVLKITLPAAIITSVANKEVAVSMLSVSLLGLSFGILYVVLAYLMTIRSSKEQRAFEILNIAGYNIGNFTLPFVQSFLGPAGVITVSLFDTGNAFICLGGAHCIASIVKGEGGNVSFKAIAGKMVRSLPFDMYILMTALAIFHIHVPKIVTELSGIIGNANAFMAMLMIGVGFKLSSDRSQMGTVAKILIVRYGVAALLAFGCFFLLPFPLEFRQALTLLVFSPIASAAPAYTAALKGDIGMSSAVNSFSIVISIICMVVLLPVIL